MNWIEKEENNLMKDQFKNTDKTLFKRVCLYILFAVLCSSHVLFSVEAENAMCKFFPDTWRCPKKGCGYENYVGINSCALCGTKKP